MLGVVVESPLGASVIVRLIGLALILTILLPVRGVNWVALTGAVVACMSFALRGHALGDPRFLLGVLVTVHILGLAFWIGALAPLERTTRAESSAQAASLAHEFGTKALWTVAALIVAGGVMLTLFGVATPAALATPYGQAFVIKLALFAGVLALAALNKLRLTPDLLAADPDSGRRLRRSIGWESALIAAILVTTAALTTVTSPPTEQAQLAPQQERAASIVLPVSGDFAWRL
jgi:putative copper resistance protein D